MKCPTCGRDDYWIWTPAINERGWSCWHKHSPGEPAGCPQLDREELPLKVRILLSVLHDGDLVYASNSDHGEHIIHAVVESCHKLGMYDQYTICRLIFEELSSHGDYWKKISDGVLSGNDPRDRCTCGKLATVSQGDAHYCSECDRGVF